VQCKVLSASHQLIGCIADWFGGWIMMRFSPHSYSESTKSLKLKFGMWVYFHMVAWVVVNRVILAGSWLTAANWQAGVQLQALWVTRHSMVGGSVAKVCAEDQVDLFVMYIGALSVIHHSWSQLPASLCHTNCVATFKHHLKTILFTAAYGVTDN